MHYERRRIMERHIFDFVGSAIEKTVAAREAREHARKLEFQAVHARSELSRIYSPLGIGARIQFTENGFDTIKKGRYAEVVSYEEATGSLDDWKCHPGKCWRVKVIFLKADGVSKNRALNPVTIGRSEKYRIINAHTNMKRTGRISL
jgi:hypothetical protein